MLPYSKSNIGGETAPPDQRGAKHYPLIKTSSGQVMDRLYKSCPYERINRLFGRDSAENSGLRLLACLIICDFLEGLTYQATTRVT